MPVPSDLVGRRVDPVRHDVDPRWTMAYAAALGEDDPRLLDTRRPDGIVAAPLFPVCLEWPVVLAVRHLAGGELDADELRRGVHATHDLVLHRPIRPPEVLWTSAEVVGVEQRSPGAFQVLRLTTIDADGVPVATTDMGTLFLGVAVAGPDRPASPPPVAGPRRDPPPVAGPVATVPVAATAAHVYTEGARIWNPIHTDPAVAAAAGLPGIILHGTATLALGVAAVLHAAGAGPDQVRRIRARFGAMVPLPTDLTVSAGPVPADPADALAFEMRLPDGSVAVRDGTITLARPPRFAGSEPSSAAR